MDKTAEQQPKIETPTRAANNFIDRHFRKLATTDLGGTLVGAAGLIANAPSRLEGILLGLAGAVGYTKLLKDSK